MSFTKSILHKETTLVKIEREIELQRYVSLKYDFCPKIIDVIYHEDKTDIVMEKVLGERLADIYSDNPKDIPVEVWTAMRKIISDLFYQDGIEYIDITSYNFMISDGKVWIIDFGHAYWCNKDGIIKNWFLRDFLEDGVNDFNPDFC